MIGVNSVNQRACFHALSIDLLVASFCSCWKAISSYTASSCTWNMHHFTLSHWSSELFLNLHPCVHSEHLIALKIPHITAPSEHQLAPSWHRTKLQVDQGEAARKCYCYKRDNMRINPNMLLVVRNTNDCSM